MPTRPTSVTVFGILNLVFAAFALFGLLGSVVMFFVKLPAGNPVIDLVNENAFYGVWLKVGLGIGSIAAFMLLVSGIGLLKLRGWARKLAIAYGVLAILIAIANTVVNATVLLPAMLEKAHQSQGPEAMGAMVGGYSAVFGGCFGTIYPILLLIFMTRPKVIAAFRTPLPPPPLPVPR